MHSFPPRNGKRALITGVTGQDGSYLAELLLYQMSLRGTWCLLVDPKNEAAGLADGANGDTVPPTTPVRPPGEPTSSARNTRVMTAFTGGRRPPPRHDRLPRF